ncbi:MAG: NPCBM/NEW2 domain-containing protein, partial [Firmicutes bacterium]|nr:NPCBM/NEW2 domain-containing protein [Bacillota bacterium]
MKTKRIKGFLLAAAMACVLTFAGVCPFVFNAKAVESGIVFLSDMEWDSSFSYSDGTWPAGTVTKDKYFADSGPIQIGGVTYAKGLSAHLAVGTPGEVRIVYDIEGLGYTGYYSVVGLQYNTAIDRIAAFEILGDYGDGDVLLAQSGLLYGNGSEEMFADITGVKTLTLRALRDGDISYGSVSWGNAVIASGMSEQE